MAIRLKNNTVFLHIPKTGGSWVADVLRANGLVRGSFSHIHADAARVQTYSYGTRQYLQSMMERIKSRVPVQIKAALWPSKLREQRAVRVANRVRPESSPKYFCFVRHPLSWYESWWRYMCGRSGSNWAMETDLVAWHPCAALRELGDADFNQFVRNVIEVHPGFVTQLYGRYIDDSTTFVGKQEHLVDDLLRALSMLNVPCDESLIRSHKRVNVSPGRAEINWDSELRAEVERLEYAGMVRFGYVEQPAHAIMDAARSEKKNV